MMETSSFCTSERRDIKSAPTRMYARKKAANGTIFGSVNNIQIAEALEKLGHNIDRRIIVLKEPVKELGKYTAKVNLHKEVSVEIPFVVVAE